MATQFDFKAATPTSAFPSGGFLFGADSQSDATPAIYSADAYLDYIRSLPVTWQATVTATPQANTSAFVASGASLTGSNAQSFVSIAGTWNTTGAPAALSMSITNTASDAASMLADFKVGGATQFSVSKAGTVHAGASNANLPNILMGASSSIVGWGQTSDTSIGLYNTSTQISLFMQNFAGQSYIGMASGSQFGFTDGDGLGTRDTILLREAAGVLGVRSGDTSPAAISFYTYASSPPSAPAASIVRLYADTSGGKIRLMALFPTGAAQQVAIEP